jgi:hypothetical protein
MLHFDKSIYLYQKADLENCKLAMKIEGKWKLKWPE